MILIMIRENKTEMRFLVNTKENLNSEIVKIFKGEKGHLSVGDISALYSDFFFILFDEREEEVIAECSVSLENEDVIEINDVLVHEKFRGKRYSELLIMNVLYHFAGREKKILAKICCTLDNIPAYRCYKKIFDLPYMKDGRYAYFCMLI